MSTAQTHQTINAGVGNVAVAQEIAKRRRRAKVSEVTRVPRIQTLLNAMIAKRMMVKRRVEDPRKAEVPKGARRVDLLSTRWKEWKQ